MHKKNIVIFEIGQRGHYAYYIESLVGKLDNLSSIPNRYYFFLSEKSYQPHFRDIDRMKEEVNFILLEEQDLFTYSFFTKSSLLLKTAEGNKQIFRFIKEWSIQKELTLDAILLLSLDRYLMSLAYSYRKEIDAPIYGILIRPFIEDANSDRKLTVFLKKQLLSRFLRKISIEEIYILMDIEKTRKIQSLYPNSNFKTIGEPVPSTYVSKDIRKYYNIEVNKQVLLCLGVIQHRKNVQGILSSLCFLTKKTRSNLAIFLVGKCIYPPVESLWKEIEDSFPEILLIRVDEFIPQEDVFSFFYSSDIICMPYINHWTSSGNLLYSAFAKKKVLAPDYGTISSIVNKYNLGVCVDPMEPEEIADGISKLLSDPIESNYEAFYNFLDENSFEKTILQL